jgi:type 1 glutamine amidotransferase
MDHEVEVNDEADVRMNYRALSDAEAQNIGRIKDAGRLILAMLGEHPSSREMSLAKTKIEEAVMWAVKGITG